MAKKHDMNPGKSGVIIFFEPMLEEVDDLDDARLGQLFRATLHYAAGGGEPDFEDETLRHIWRFVRTAVIRDDKSYTKKVVGKQYGMFCRYAKEHHYTPMSREEWEELGAPTFKEWERGLLLENDTNVYNVPFCIATSASGSSPSSNPSSTSSSVSESVSETETGAETPPDGGGADTDADTPERELPSPSPEQVTKKEVPAYEIPSLEQVRQFCIQERLITNPVYYYNYQRTNGWTMGKDHQRIKDWQAHLIAWDIRDRERAAASPNPKGNEVRKYAQDLQRRRGGKH